MKLFKIALVIIIYSNTACGQISKGYDILHNKIITLPRSIDSVDKYELTKDLIVRYKDNDFITNAEYGKLTNLFNITYIDLLDKIVRDYCKKNISKSQHLNELKLQLHAIEFNEQDRLNTRKNFLHQIITNFDSVCTYFDSVDYYVTNLPCKDARTEIFKQSSWFFLSFAASLNNNLLTKKIHTYQERLVEHARQREILEDEKKNYCCNCKHNGYKFYIAECKELQKRFYTNFTIDFRNDTVAINDYLYLNPFSESNSQKFFSQLDRFDNCLLGSDTSFSALRQRVRNKIKDMARRSVDINNITLDTLFLCRGSCDSMFQPYGYYVKQCKLIQDRYRNEERSKFLLDSIAINNYLHHEIYSETRTDSFINALNTYTKFIFSSNYNFNLYKNTIVKSLDTLKRLDDSLNADAKNTSYLCQCICETKYNFNVKYVAKCNLMKEDNKKKIEVDIAEIARYVKGKKHWQSYTIAEIKKINKIINCPYKLSTSNKKLHKYSRKLTKLL